MKFVLGDSPIQTCLPQTAYGFVKKKKKKKLLKHFQKIRFYFSKSVLKMFLFKNLEALSW